jgi:cytochrome c553
MPLFAPIMPSARTCAKLVLPLLAACVFAPATWAQQVLPPSLVSKVATCAACHGVDGHATLPNTPHLAGQPRLFLENRLVMIREGLSAVPAMKGMLDGLTDEELTALARHYAQMPLSPARATRNDTKAAKGAAISQRMLCATCHLPNYVGREQMPRLSGQREDYLVQSMRDFLAGRTAGRDTLMTNALLGLTEADISDLAHHLATWPAP